MLVGRPGLTPSMVGRDAELQRVLGAVAQGPAPAVALIGGEAGVGKTRLVQEALTRLGTDVRALAGQSSSGSPGRAFDLAIDVLGGAGTLGAGDREALVLDDTAPTEARARAALDLLSARASATPSVVVFDDLHWADTESLQVLERMAEPGSGPLLLVGTYRPDALTRRHPAADLIGRLERRRGVTHVHLDRLGAADVGRFLELVYGRQPSHRVVSEVHRRTEGNPFYLEELLAAADLRDPELLVGQPLPWTLGELVRSQLEGLDADERRVIETASVLERRLGFDVLATVSGFDEERLIPILRGLVERNLLLEPEPDVFAFRHALAREAIEAELLGRERRRIHEAALAVLRRAEPVDHAAVAHHARGAGRYGEMVAAAREGAQRAYESGAALRALGLAELGLTEASDDPVLLLVAGQAALLASLYHDAMAHARALLAVARRTDDVPAESEALRLVARLQWALGDPDEAVETARSLTKLFDRLGPTADKAAALASLAQVHMLAIQPEEAVAWADAAIDLAGELGLHRVRVQAEVEKGSALVHLPERTAEGLELLHRARDEAEQLGEWMLASRAIYNGLLSDRYRPDPGALRADLARMLADAERGGCESWSTDSYWNGLAELAEWEGDLEAAMAYLHEAELWQRRSLGMRGTSWPRIHAAGLALELGDPTKADELTAPPRQPAPADRPWWYGQVLHVAALRGDVDTALAAAERLVASQEPIGTEPQLAHDVVRALLRAGAPPDRVAEIAERFDLYGEPLPDRAGPWRSLLDGQLAAARGDQVAAARCFEAATAEGHQVMRPHVMGSAHVGAAGAHLALGSTARADEHLAAARELLARWGGRRVDELRDLERRRHVPRPDGEPGGGPGGLTPREREIAALLTEGLTNGDLAARLYISPKTASVHVSNILAKLGMTSRAEIAAYAVRSGIAGR